jgi:hypothetical protein
MIDGRNLAMRLAGALLIEKIDEQESVKIMVKTHEVL